LLFITIALQNLTKRHFSYYYAVILHMGGVNMKRFVKIFIACLFIFFSPLVVRGENVRLLIDGDELTNLPVPPILVNARTLVPFREVFEHVGGIVGWHGGHRQVTLFHGNDVLVMTIDSTHANLNGQAIQMQVPPIIHEGRTMVPLRFPAEIFGFEVDWDNEMRAAIVNSPGNGNNNGNGNASENENTAVDRETLLQISNTSFLGDSDVQQSPTPSPAPQYEEYDGDSDKIVPVWDGNDLPPPGVTVSTGAGNANLARDISSSPVQTIPHPQTTVTSLLTPAQVGTAAYVIVASSAISEVHHFLLPDNRLVVDIHNANSNISGDFPVPDNVPVSGVRASQFSQTPRVTRVVFDVIGAAEYSISLSADRTLLTVSFSQNNITNILTQSDALSDSLFIQGDVLPSINISTEGFPHFLTINIDNASMETVTGLFENGVFASHFVTGQRNDGSAFIHVFVRGSWPSFSIAHSANSVAFMMHYGVSGVRYDSVNRELRISREFAMDIHQIPQINDYLRFRYTFVLPPAAEVLGRGEISVLDGFVNSVGLTHDAAGNVLLTFNTARVLTFSVHQDADYYIIRAHLPRDVSPFIVVIDPGHGGSDPGTIHNGVVEKELTLAVSQKIMQLLNADPFITAYMTRHDDVYVSLLGRAEFANNLGADMFVSIHANAAALNRTTINPYPHGIATWYTISPPEAAENHNLNSRQLAQIIQRHKINASNANDRGARHEPNFVVLRETNMPAVLLELGFLTNPAEAARLADSAYRWTLAHAIYQGIVEAFAAHPPTR
jgi:N-acetylmuramoyl-L-alanine amidase